VLVATGVVGLVAASFVLPGALRSKSSPAAAHAGMAMAAEGAGLRVGSRVPSFTERDVVTGKPLTSRSLFARKTLLFFSEGVMCQACFEQIRGLEQVGNRLASRGIQLISITPDGPADLRQAIHQYGIQTPMISDADRSMSRAFNTLGQGMHADTPGHAFALIDRGKVLWYRDYWLAPTQTMYVEPQQLLRDIGRS
jgi:peroxiredoxin Q/BCP